MPEVVPLRGVAPDAAGPAVRRIPFWLAAAALVTLVTLAYLPALRAGFIWDDDDYIVNNTLLSQPEGLERSWLSLTATPQYYPMVFTTFWIERRLWGLDPMGYHAVNIAIHAGTAVLLYAVLRRLGVPLALFAAAAFAVHPVHTESVAWVTERKNTLSALFYMAALLSYLRFAGIGSGTAGSAQPPRWNLYLWALLFFVLALLSKTVTCSLPAAILLIQWWRRGYVGRRDLALVAPMFALGFLGAATTSWVERHHVGTVDLDLALTPADRMLVAGRAVWFYLGKILIPMDLSFIYTKWRVDPRVWWQYLYPATAAGVVLSLWLSRRRIGRGPVVAAFFFAGTLLPALGFVDVYPMEFSYVADHFQYLASLGPIVAIAAAVGVLAGQTAGRHGVPRPWLGALCILTIGALAVLTAQQTLIYRDLETLWQDTLRKNPACALALNNLGAMRVRTGRNDEGARYYEQAIQANPRYTVAYNNLANLWLELGDAPRADGVVRRLLEFDLRSPRTHLTAAKVAKACGRHEEAAAHFVRAVELQPSEQSLRLAAAQELLRAGRPTEAVAQAKLALTRPGDLARSAGGVRTALDVLGAALAACGRTDEAMAKLEEALRMAPDDGTALYQTAAILAAKGKDAEATERARAAIRFGQKDADAYALLGVLLGRSPGHEEEARRWLEEALAMDRAHAAAHLALGKLDLAAGRKAEATEHFTAALRQNPQDADAKAAMAEVLSEPPG